MVCVISVIFGEYLIGFVGEMIQFGCYGNILEVFCDVLRLMEVCEQCV